MSMTLNAKIYYQKGYTVGEASKTSAFHYTISEEGGHVYVWEFGI